MSFVEVQLPPQVQPTSAKARVTTSPLVIIPGRVADRGQLAEAFGRYASGDP